jgi:AcrR family transcriptional regulator
MFATSGVDAPVREIAEKAGVGTVYLHFPQRSDLIAAVFRREIDACADAAPILAAEHEPREALARWMQRGKSDGRAVWSIMINTLPERTGLSDYAKYRAKFYAK